MKVISASVDHCPYMYIIESGGIYCLLATPTIAVLEFSVNIEYDITDVRRAELLTGGPRFVGSPKIKSAFAFPPPPITRATTNPSNTYLIFELPSNFISRLPFCPSGQQKTRRKQQPIFWRGLAGTKRSALTTPP